MRTFFPPFCCAPRKCSLLQSLGTLPGPSAALPSKELTRASPGTSTRVLTRTPVRPHTEDEPCTPIWCPGVQACPLRAHTAQSRGWPGVPRPQHTHTCDTNTLPPDLGLQTPPRRQQGARHPLTQGLDRAGPVPTPHRQADDVKLFVGLGPESPPQLRPFSSSPGALLGRRRPWGMSGSVIS